VTCRNLTPKFQLKALGLLYAFEESADYALLSYFCDDSNLRISIFKYVLSTMGVSKESISKFLIFPEVRPGPLIGKKDKLGKKDVNQINARAVIRPLHIACV